MVQNYQRHPGARKYKDYLEGSLEKAVKAVRKCLSHQKAAIAFGIARATLNRPVSGPINTPCRTLVLPVEEQQKLAEYISMAREWGFPLTVFDIRLIVKEFRDRSGRTEPRFKNNTPGADFVLSFVQRQTYSL